MKKGEMFLKSLKKWTVKKPPDVKVISGWSVVTSVQPWSTIKQDYNGSWVLFYSENLLDCQFDLMLKCSYIKASICHPSVLFVLYVTWLRPLLELISSLNCPQSFPCCHSKWDLQVTCSSSQSFVLMINKCPHFVSKLCIKGSPLCTDNIEPHRKACEIIITSSLSSLLSPSTSSYSSLVPQSLI